MKETIDAGFDVFMLEAYQHPGIVTTGLNSYSGIILS
jgi:hypothetical protein